MRWLIGLGLVIGVAFPGQAADQKMLFHAEAGDDHRVVSTECANRSFNPASVLKVATSLLALKTLGPDHRYITDFACRGPCSIEEGRLLGDLVIVGGDDPDFQAENAWLVAHELTELGITTISGDVIVEDVFYQGWEHGSEQRQTDRLRRAQLMGGRFRQTLDVTRWTQTHHATWEDAAPRHGWPQSPKPAISFEGSVRLGPGGEGVFHPLVRHLSNPLAVTLGRFNTFSNNDIIRVADPIGGPEAIEEMLKAITEGVPGEIRVSTASGERVNRLTARQVVRLLWAFEEICRNLDLDVSEILPVPGCVPGSLPRMFPRLAKGEGACTAVVKSGSLTTTDGGVAVLAGFFRSLEGETVAFCVGAPRAGMRLRQMRLAEQNWLLDLMGSLGGAVRRNCGAPLMFSDTMARAKKVRLFPVGDHNGESDAEK